MSIYLKTRREALGVSAAKLADMADVDFNDLINLEVYGGEASTDRTIRKVFNALGQIQRRALTPNEQEHLLQEVRDPIKALRAQKQAEKERPLMREREEKRREELLQAAKMREQYL